MAWPTPQDYNEALQFPSLAFIDPELRQGTPQLDNLGLPRPISGQFASVYRISSGGRQIAVRCFRSEFRDQQERYAAISAHLASVHIPERVEFEYQSEGIRIGARTYPILKMEWIEGTTLDRYVDANFRNREKIATLIERFYGLVGHLIAGDVAHGDLQHGNVLVADVAGLPVLRLIDYDGMWVPALSGRLSLELGHSNYQHPNRSPSSYGKYLDAFSAWSILTSLLGILAEPDLWVSVRGGEERLLFARPDYQSPWDSRALTAVKTVLPAELEAFPERLFDLSLESDITSFESPPAPAAMPHATPTGPKSSWWQEDSGASMPSQASTAFAWGREKPAIRRFADSARAERLVLLLSIATVAGLTAMTLSPSLPVLVVPVLTASVVLAAAITVAVLYGVRPEVAERRRVSSQVKFARRSLQQAQRNLKKVEGEMRGGTKAQAAELSAAQAEVQSASADEAVQLKRIETELAKTEAGLRDERAALDQSEAQEMRNALQQLRERELAAKLNRYRVSDASVPGLGTTLLYRVAASGIGTAADFVGIGTVSSAGSYGYTKEQVVFKLRTGRSIHVDGVGQAKAQALETWRRQVVAEVSRLLPGALPPQDVQQIRVKYETRRTDLGEQQRRARQVGADDRRKVIDVATARKERAAKRLVDARVALAKVEAPFQTVRRGQEREVARLRADLARTELEMDAFAAIRPTVLLRLILVGWLPRRSGSSRAD